MVKKAEKVRRRSPLLPVLGLVLAVGLFVIAYGLAGLAIQRPEIAKQLDRSTLGTAQIAFGIGIWLVLMAVSFFLVSLLAGKDPDKAPPLPPKEMFRKSKGRR